MMREGLPGSLSYRRYRAPGVHRLRAVEVASVAFAATRRRVVLVAQDKRVIDIPVGRPLPDGVWTRCTPTSVAVAYDAGQFHPDQSGTVTVTLHSPEAPQIATYLGG